VTERILVDTGPMVALFSEEDAYHEHCSDALTALSPPLVTCWPVVTEAAWLLRTRSDDFNNLLKSFAGGLFALLSLDAGDMPAIAALLRRYESCGLQLADAALAHLAERENIRTVFTLDRRDFAIIRLQRDRALRLIPEIS